MVPIHSTNSRNAVTSLQCRDCNMGKYVLMLIYMGRIYMSRKYMGAYALNYHISKERMGRNGNLMRWVSNMAPIHSINSRNAVTSLQCCDCNMGKYVPMLIYMGKIYMSRKYIGAYALNYHISKEKMGRNGNLMR